MPIDRILEQQEPYPMTVLDRRYANVRRSRGADRLFARILGEPAALDFPPNIFRVLFAPRLTR